ncbi:MAG: NADP-specific glutamate dehydrogenase [Bacteroidales bacterium]|nr:NADP-specific glutamate dehydrogenase [Bacteroidales bacterium]
MEDFTSRFVEGFMGEVIARNPGESEFHQAVKAVVESVAPYIVENPHIMDAKVLERLVEPERIIIFRVPWTDDREEIHINRGFRVQNSSAIGPYKGGIRFHPSVNLSIMKFLAFEQTFKNALTTLPMGGAKGGSDFNPRGKSDAEVMRFCQSFMTELYRHIGADTDVPAGDIGVGGREIGFLFGQYKRLKDQFTGTLTGKGLGWGGSLLRPEATGYGLCYFALKMLEGRGETFQGKKVNISGAGNVAQYAAQKAMRLGAKVQTLSDSDGFVFDPDGLTEEKMQYVFRLKNIRRGRIKEYVQEYPSAQYFPGERPWKIPCDIALPCATQNEIEPADAENIVKGGAILLAEGANMPTTPEAVKIILAGGLLYAPGKASNAGGVAVSGLEMSQNSMRTSWTADEVDHMLRRIMSDIHASCVKYGTLPDGTVDYVRGANTAGFIKVADAMLDQGLV